jgi:hypothetical protein
MQNAPRNFSALGPAKIMRCKAPVASIIDFRGMLMIGAIEPFGDRRNGDNGIKEGISETSYILSANTIFKNKKEIKIQQDINYPGFGRFLFRE